MAATLLTIQEGKMREIARLYHFHDRPLLALKAYDALITDVLLPSSEVDCTLYFCDYVLHCNAFALNEFDSGNGSADAARDYFRLALAQFETVKGISLFEEHLGTFSLESNAENITVLSSDADVSREIDNTSANPLLFPRAKLESSTLTLLALTLSNWACVEFTARNARKAFALLRLSCFSFVRSRAADRNCEARSSYQAPLDDVQNGHDAGSQSDEESGSNDVDVALNIGLLGYRAEVANAINQCVCQVMHCNFPEAEDSLTAILSALQQRQQSLHNSEEKESKNDSDVGSITRGRQQERADVATLTAMAAFAMGTAQEYTFCEPALAVYQEAIALLTAAAAPPALVTTASVTLSKLAVFVTEMGERAAAEQAVEQARREAAKKSASAAAKKSSAAAGGGGIKRGGGGAAGGATLGRKRVSMQMTPRALVAPPIGHALRTYMRQDGLPTLITSVLDLREVFDWLMSGRDEEPRRSSESFSSPLYDTLPTLKNDDASSSSSSSCATPDMPHRSVLAVLMCAETPLQWSVLAERAQSEPPARRSVWSPRVAPALPFFSSLHEGPSTAQQQQQLWRSSRVSLSADKNASAMAPAPPPRPVLKILMPKPIPKAALENAQKEVGAVTKLLGQRLNMLLKNERVFEDRWQATQRVKKALLAYYIPQELLRFKTRMAALQRIKAMREDRCARVITRFFRLVMVERPLQNGFLSRQQRREMEEERAAVALQKYVRRWNAMQERRRLVALRQGTVDKVVVAQSVYRRRAAQRRCSSLRAQKISAEKQQAVIIAREFAATEIQRVFRGHYTRRCLMLVQGFTHAAMLRHFRDSRHYYATLIQSRVRGMQTRQIWGRAVYAKRCFGRNTYRRLVLEHACVIIQRFYRGYLARRRYAPAIHARCVAAIVEDEAHQKALIEAKTAEHEYEVQCAAARIQSVYRATIAKQLLVDMKAVRADMIASRKGEVYTPFNIESRQF